LTHSKFQGLVHTEFERSARYHTPLSLVLIDLDQFDAYNQAVGYQAGDQALRNIADMLGTKVRTVDTIARFGPDEFAVLLPETNRAGAYIAAERFQAGIAGLPWMRRLLTASLSVTLLTPDVADAHAFIDRARQILRDTKVGGPGRIAVSDETVAAAPVATSGSRRKRA
jgi:diguanylate cyclase (GGDEF)-like protein